MYYMLKSFSTISTEVPAIRVRCNGTLKFKAPECGTGVAVAEMLEFPSTCVLAKNSTASSKKIFIVIRNNHWTNIDLYRPQYPYKLPK